jgi:hypothetical protein
MRSFANLIGLVTVALVSGCASTTTLQVTQQVPLLDQSVPTPQKPAYSIVMVLPPKGSERGEVSELANLEKALLKQGVRVISSGVTGRVVIDNAEGQKNEGAAQLTDLERALILARKSGAEALLQVADMKWAKEPNKFRYYLLQQDGKTFAEVSKADFDGAGSEKQWMITGPSLHFEAKLIDVESGEIVAAVDISQSTAHELSSKIVPVTVKGGSIVPNVQQATEVDSPDLREGAVQDMMGKLAAIIAQGKPHEARPTANEVALGAAKKKCEEDLAKSETERQRLAAAEAKRVEEDKRRAEAEAAVAAAAADASKKAPIALHKK